MTGAPPARPPWPLRWFKDEQFWREVAVQLIGTGAILLIGLVIVVLGGFVATKDVLATEFTASFFALVVALLGILVTIQDSRWQKQQVAAGHLQATGWRRRLTASRVVWGILAVASTLAIAALYLSSVKHA